MKSFLIIFILFLTSTVAFSKTTVILIDEDEAIKVMKGYNDFVGQRDVERENYRRRISRESQILREKLEKFKYDSSAMSPSIKKTEEEELKKYSNVVRKLDFKLKSEIDAREEKARKQVEIILKKEIKSYGKKNRYKLIFNVDKSEVLYRARGVSPLNIKVLKQDENIPNETKSFMKYQNLKNGIKEVQEEE